MCSFLGSFHTFMFVDEFTPNIHELDHRPIKGRYHLHFLHLVRARLWRNESRVILRFFLLSPMPYPIYACFLKQERYNRILSYVVMRSAYQMAGICETEHALPSGTASQNILRYLKRAGSFPSASISASASLASYRGCSVSSHRLIFDICT